MLSLLNSTATSVFNKDGQVIAILAGQPKGATEESWCTLHNEAFEAMARGKNRPHLMQSSCLIGGVSFLHCQLELPLEEAKRCIFI
jgi:hypothetical protein